MIRNIVTLVALPLVACSAWSYLVSPTYPVGRCHYTEKECSGGGCCPASTRCTANGCVADPDYDDPFKLAPDAGR